MAVMMQGFYWDCAIKEDKKGEWWNYLNAEIPKLGKRAQASMRSGFRLFPKLLIRTRMAMIPTTISIWEITTKKVR
jgi:hypothetical protein